MAVDLLATKTRVPPAPHHLLDRPRLVRALAAEVPRHRVALVTAPAGYGKTTLLAQWARTSRLPVAWISLGREDNDPERLLRYLAAAWATVQPGIRERPVGLLPGTTSPDIDAVLAAFINTGAEMPGTTVFVLDDVHLIDDTATCQALTSLLDHLPPRLHFVLSGRGVPPVPVARYRARGELREWQAEDVRLDLGETRDYLGQRLGRQVDERTLASINDRLEGWVAGLQLVALSRHPDMADPPRAIGGRHRFIADYLNDDVLALLPARVRRFLLQTSILDRLSAPLCNAVTGGDDSQDLLESLERDQLFIVALDDTREWYRYHHLFADVLRQQLAREGTSGIAELHRRAARWYLAQGSPEPALHHAVAANDAATGFAILEGNVNILINTGQIRTLHRWLTMLPPDWRRQYPTIGLAEAGLLLSSGAFMAAVQQIDAVERDVTTAPTPDSSWQMARVSAIRCFIACVQNDIDRAESWAHQALPALLEGDVLFRANIYHALGDTYRRHGRWDDARASYLKVLDTVHDPSLPFIPTNVYGALADLEFLRGHLRTACAFWSRAEAIIRQPESWGLLPLPIVGWVELRLGEILYEWNDLDRARARLVAGLERAELGGDVRARIAGHTTLARLHLTDGDAAAAEAALARAAPLVAQGNVPDWTSRFERCQLEVLLARNEVEAALARVNVALTDDTTEHQADAAVHRLAMARVLIVRGDAPSLERAGPLLARLAASAEAEGRLGVRIEALALQAIRHWARDDQAAAMTTLESALALAEPEGYLRTFADLGAPMARLLHEARARGVTPGYVSALLAAGDPGQGTIPVLLSHRELEVLRLVAAGLTNREVADTLFVSPETIKKHTSSIYSKLGVRNRTEAVARCRDLGLLDRAPRDAPEIPHPNTPFGE